MDTDGRLMQVTPQMVRIVGLGILAAWIAVPAFAYLLFDEWPSRGQFGDVFGAVNALFSGLAFAGLIFAILLQREDLELQRAELALTREELARSAHAQVQSELALREQANAAVKSSRLAAINFLLDHYRKELESFKGIAYHQGSSVESQLNTARQRNAALISELDKIYLEVIAPPQTAV